MLYSNTSFNFSKLTLITSNENDKEKASNFLLYFDANQKKGEESEPFSNLDLNLSGFRLDFFNEREKEKA